MKTVSSLLTVAVLALGLTFGVYADDQKSSTSKDTNSSKQASSQNSTPSTASNSSTISSPATPTSTHPSTGSASSSEHSLLGDVFTHETLRGMIGTVVYFCIALIFFGFAYKFADWVTPGNLGNELLGTGRPNGTPNYALAGVVGAMLLGLSIIIAAAIH